MKNIFIVIGSGLIFSFVQAEEIKVYTQGVSKEEIKKDMPLMKHNWSTTGSEPKHKRRSSIKKTKEEMKCNTDKQNKIKKHKRRPSKKGVRTERIKF